MVDKVDPFVKVTMFYDEQHEDVGRTATVSASTDPNFATGGADGDAAACQVTVYVGTKQGGDARFDQVMLSVYDEDEMAGSEDDHEFLGRALLPAKAVAAAAEGLLDDSAATGPNGELTLNLGDPPNARRQLAKGSLVVRVDPHGSAPDQRALARHAYDGDAAAWLALPSALVPRLEVREAARREPAAAAPPIPGCA